MRKYSFLFLLALCLSACGGEGGSTPLSYSMAVIGPDTNLDLIDVDNDGSVYFFDTSLLSHKVWLSGSFSNVSIADSPLGTGFIKAVRGTNIAITSNDPGDGHKRSFVKISGTWHELPFHWLDNPSITSGNTVVTSVDSSGNCAYYCTVGGAGSPEPVFRYKASTGTGVSADMNYAATINESGLVTGTKSTLDPITHTTIYKAATYDGSATMTIDDPNNASCAGLMTNANGTTLSNHKWIADSGTAASLPEPAAEAGWGLVDPVLLDNSGNVVGNQTEYDSGSHAIENRPWVFHEGTWTKLDTLIPTDSLYELDYAVRISPNGKIVCNAHLKTNPTSKVLVLLTPD